MDDFEEFKKDLRDHHNSMLVFLEHAEDEALQAGHKKLVEFIRLEKNKVTSALESLSEKSKDLYSILKRTLGDRTGKLEKQIEDLNKTKDTLVSDNLLLEYKKKDLLQLTSKLEETNVEILIKNKELVHQQQQITDQANKLNTIHEEILEKHRELERQKEALLDQSDYLHEANQTITLMHEEVQNQKNEILQKNDELLSLNNEKNNLIGIVAHDLKSPLNQMKGLISVIKMSAASLDRETISCLEMMEKSAERLTNLIAKILDVEAIESQQLNLIIEKINLSEILHSLTERFRLSAMQKKITLHFSSSELEIFAQADKIYTTQVFENLISNAVKFSPGDTNIYISLQIINGEAIGKVRDEGPGISDDDKKKLFGKYQKLSARPTGNESSTGLGLSIVKKFVEAMNGRIWCESELGKGATFLVAFRAV